MSTTHKHHTYYMCTRVPGTVEEKNGCVHPVHKIIFTGYMYVHLYMYLNEYMYP